MYFGIQLYGNLQMLGLAADLSSLSSVKDLCSVALQLNEKRRQIIIVPPSQRIKDAVAPIDYPQLTHPIPPT
jgi:hypothetical protein